MYTAPLKTIDTSFIFCIGTFIMSLTPYVLLVMHDSAMETLAKSSINLLILNLTFLHYDS